LKLQADEREEPRGLINFGGERKLHTEAGIREKFDRRIIKKSKGERGEDIYKRLNKTDKGVWGPFRNHPQNTK